MIHYQSWHETGWSPSDGYWDQAMLKDLLERVPPQLNLNLLVTPGHWRTSDAINDWLRENGPAIVWITSDEEGDCPFWLADTPVWKQMPNPHRPYWPDRVLPLGYTPHTRPALQGLGLPEVKGGWVLTGQNTNVRRKAAFTALERIDPTRIHPTNTFAAHTAGSGIQPDEYIKQLWEAEWAPSPAGNVRADSFRMWEALEAGAVPIIDATSPHNDPDKWSEMLGDHPLPVIQDWSDVGDILRDAAPMAEAGVWYTRYKRDLIKTLCQDWMNISDNTLWDPPRVRIASVITASPIPSHPGFEILAETVESVRERLPGNEICVAFDGPRPEDDRLRYEEHIRRVAWWANQYWPEVWLHYSGKWKHQAGTLKDVLAEFDQTVLVMEHDTPLVGEIPWDSLVATLYTGEVDLIRLHYDVAIHPDHQYLMRGHINAHGNHLIKTVQHSQRPHLARAQFYRDLLGMIPDGARTYVEDCVYGPIANSPWEHHKMAIYAPEGDMKRSTHLDGRAGEEKGKFWW